MSDTRKTTKPNVPNLRFPGFSGEWELKCIDEISPLQRGFDLPSQSLQVGSVPVVYSNGIMNYHNESKCVAPGIVTGRSGTIGRLTYIESGPYWPHNTSLWVTDFKGNIPLFVYYLLEHIDLSRFSSGSGVPTLNRNDVHAFKTCIPSVEEQHKIADCLSIIDKRISIQNKVIEDLKKLKTALEERMLGQCQGKQVRLRDILIERVEKSRINNQYEVLSSTVSGIYSQREYFNKEIASADNTGYKAIHRGDVVLSPQNLWMGNINYNDRFEIGIVSPSYKVFSIDEKFDKGYIAFLLKTRKALWAYSLVSEQGASIVRRNLNYESFLEISFVIPSLKEQQATARRLSAFKQKQTMEEAFLRSLLLQKEFMLKSLFI